MGCKRGAQRVLKNNNLPDKEAFRQYLQVERTQRDMCAHFNLKWCELRVLLDHFSNELTIYESREVKNGKLEVYYGLLKNDGIVNRYIYNDHDDYCIPENVMNFIPRGV